MYLFIIELFFLLGKSSFRSNPKFTWLYFKINYATMSFGLSIGDIILCSQITYRLLAAATSGRKNAPIGLRELEDTLFGLNYSLSHLQRASNTVLSRSNYDAGDIHRQLGFMIRSCRQTLETLEKATAKYRETAKKPVPMPQSYKGLKFCSQHKFTTQVKIQWRRFIWDLKGESLSRYRRKLESHTDAINLLLVTCIWYVLNHYPK